MIKTKQPPEAGSEMYKPYAEVGGHEGGPCKDKKVKGFGATWIEFFQNTTLHGVREIAEPQPFVVRR